MPGKLLVHITKIFIPYLKKKKKKCGIYCYYYKGFVTTTRVTHATPAALYAHSSNRNWECDSQIPLPNRNECNKDIARQLIEDEPGRNIKVSNITSSLIVLCLLYSLVCDNFLRSFWEEVEPPLNQQMIMERPLLQVANEVTTKISSTTGK